jgi:predicted nucleotidyltransferase
LVAFEPEARAFANYFDFKEKLEALLGRPVDLVMPGAVENPYLRAGIERSRESVFAA